MTTIIPNNRNDKRIIMKKLFTVNAYSAYDYTSNCMLTGGVLATIEECEIQIRIDDAERRERWRRSKWYNQGRVNPFEHHEYAVVELVGTAELDIEDENYEPSFYEICREVEDWRDGDYIKKYEF